MNTVLTLSKEIELVLIRSLSPKTLLLLGPVCWLIQTPSTSIMGTRGVEAFLKKTAIAYHQNLTFLLGSRPYAIAVFFKNASTPRV